LLKNPHLLQKLRHEAKSVFAGHLSKDNKVISLPKFEELSKLQFAEASLRESLRLYSVVPSVVRVAAEDIQCGSYFFAKGSTIILNIQGVHHNPEYWPNPHVYDPERFIGDRAKQIQPFTFLPFIDGPRMCIGQYLSLMESKIVLACLVLSYDFDVLNLNEASKKHQFMIPIIPENGHIMKVK
jgi:beta-ring hydroxylase